MALRIIVSLSYKTVRNIFWATAVTVLSSFNTSLICPLTFSIPSPMHPITICTIAILKPGLLSPSSNTNSWYFQRFSVVHFINILLVLSHAMSIIIIFLSSRSLSTRSGLCPVSVFLELNKIFLLCVSITFPHSHFPCTYTISCPIIMPSILLQGSSACCCASLCIPLLPQPYIHLVAASQFPSLLHIIGICHLQLSPLLCSHPRLNHLLLPTYDGCNFLWTEGPRAMCGANLMEKKRTEDLMEMLGLTETAVYMAKANGVRWYGHVLRRDDGTFWEKHWSLKWGARGSEDDQRRRGRFKWRRRARALVWRKRTPWIEWDGEWELERLLLG